ncbi:unnamed protein product [Phytophthora fragariaefolia]|uniref:Unnamed protein product n=1 Tax=Phytophthora fragariaefolia TaxID=1490495 RepID=A0A9W6WUV6_9STRA|nr:unnamed protein product [Phytophthora fragariaefolia]
MSTEHINDHREVVLGTVPPSVSAPRSSSFSNRSFFNFPTLKHLLIPTHQTRLIRFLRMGRIQTYSRRCAGARHEERKWLHHWYGGASGKTVYPITNKELISYLNSSDPLFVVLNKTFGRQFLTTNMASTDSMTISNSYFDGNTDYSASCDGHHYWSFIFYGTTRFSMLNNYIHGTSPKIGGES